MALFFRYAIIVATCFPFLINFSSQSYGQPPLKTSGAPAQQILASAEPQFIAIDEDGGGAVIDYARRMFQIRQAGTKVHFKGRCDSACTLFLALPGAQTCVTQNAVFRFHAPTSSTNTDVTAVQSFLMRQYPDWVRAWITDHGGLSHDLIVMNYAYVHQFLRTCA